MTVKMEEFSTYMDDIAEGTVKGLCKMMNSSDVVRFLIEDKDSFEKLIRNYAVAVCDLVKIDNVEVNTNERD